MLLIAEISIVHTVCIDVSSRGGLPASMPWALLPLIVVLIGQSATAASGNGRERGGAGLELELLAPRTVCVARGEAVAEVPLRLACRGGDGARAAGLTLTLLIDGREHSRITPAADDAVSAALAGGHAFRWPTRVALRSACRSAEVRAAWAGKDGQELGGVSSEIVAFCIETCAAAEAEPPGGAGGVLSSSHPRPSWRLPFPGSHLCHRILLQTAGIEAVLARYPGLHLVATLDGSLLPADKLLSSELFPVSVPNGEHAVSLELVNRTTHGATAAHKCIFARPPGAVGAACADSAACLQQVHTSSCTSTCSRSTRAHLRRAARWRNNTLSRARRRETALTVSVQGGGTTHA